jgi:hypothetical protein
VRLRILAVVYRTPLLLYAAAAAVFAVGHFIIAEGREGLNRYNSRNQKLQQK